MKRILALILVLALSVGMAVTLVACGDESGESSSSSSSKSTKEGDPDAEDVILDIVHDGDATKITDSTYDEYFDGDAKAGVEDLLNEGKVYVNGIKVPATEDETTDYQVNGVSSLYKTDSGWGYNVHKTTSADNLSFDDARMGFFETITTVRGHETFLYGDSSTGLVNKIDAQSFEVFRIESFDNHGGMVDKISRGDFELETDRVRLDVDTITVSSSNFDDEIEVGDIVLYYNGPDGWVMNKADYVTGTLSKTEDDLFATDYGKDDEYISIESNVSRYNLINCNRPTQFYDSYEALELTDVPVRMWLTPSGHPLCFTYGTKEDGKAALTEAIEHATADKEGVVVSADNGADVPKGTKWVTQEDMDDFDQEIQSAQAVCDNNSAAEVDYDNAIYSLALALGESGENPSGFLGAQGEGTQG